MSLQSNTWRLTNHLRPRFTLMAALLALSVLAGVLAFFFPPAVTTVVVDFKRGNPMLAPYEPDTDHIIQNAASILLRSRVAKQNPQFTRDWLVQHVKTTVEDGYILSIHVRGAPYRAAEHLKVAQDLASILAAGLDKTESYERELSYLIQRLDQLTQEEEIGDRTRHSTKDESAGKLAARMAVVKQELRDLRKPQVFSARTRRAAVYGW